MANAFVGNFVMAAFLAVLGLLVLAAHPGRAANRLLSAMLVLQGAADAAYELMRSAPDPSRALAHARIGDWYQWPVLFLILPFLHHLLRPLRWERAMRAAVAVNWVALAAVLAAAALDPSVLDRRLIVTNGRYAIYPVWPYLPAAELLHALQALAVLLAAWGATSARRSMLQRRQVALVGVAFAFLLGNATATFVARLFRPLFGFSPLAHIPFDSWLLLATAPVLALSLPRLVQAFEGKARAVVVGAMAVAILGGAGKSSLVDVQEGLGIIRLEDWGRFVVVAAHAFALALAIVRYDLGGLGDRLRQRVRATANVLLVGAVLYLPAGLAVAATAGSTAGLVVAALLALAAAALSPTAFDWISQAVPRVLPPASQEWLDAGVRARTYCEAMEGRLSADGRPNRPEDARALAALRSTLRISARDHAMLVAAWRLRQERRSASAVLLGRYRIEAELGRGGTASVWAATDAATGQRVVVKRFATRRAGGRVAREARALAAVRHPRVVSLLDVERVGSEVFLVMAWAEGQSAQDLLAERGPLEPRRAAAICLDALEGLAALHRAGVVHGDVTLRNVLVGRDGRAMLCDLGSAHFILPDATLTGTGVEASLSTVAPEVLQGQAATPASDVYAVGAVLYRLLAGRHYVGLDEGGLLRAQQAILLQEPRLARSGIPRRLAAVVGRALRKRPGERFAGAEAMAVALRQAASPQPKAAAVPVPAALVRGPAQPARAPPVPPGARRGPGRPRQSSRNASTERPTPSTSPW